MEDSYEFFACIDFEVSNFAISVPLLKRRGSNYTYVPRTDHRFIIVDFYEMLDIGYAAHHLASTERCPVSIGQKCPVPILEGGTVYVVDPYWSEDELKQRQPGLGKEATKAFLSLRERLGSKSISEVHDAVEIELADLLSEPVRSKYWISRYRALMKSAFEAGTPPKPLQVLLENARSQWLEKFASKTSLKHVRAMIQTPHLAVDEEGKRGILIDRFTRMLYSKGIFMPPAEVRAYADIFPGGILFSMDARGENLPVWERDQQLSRFLSDQMYELTQRHVGGDEPRKDDPDKWTNIELSRLLQFFTALTAQSDRLDEPCNYLVPLFQRMLASLRFRTARRHALLNAVELSQTTADHEWLMTIGWSDGVRLYETDVTAGVSKLLDDYDKLITISKIVRPLTRDMALSEIAFKGIDHALIDAMRMVYRENSPRTLRSLLL
jgi:hypothetical protein